MLILTEDCIICARDYLGRTPIVIGKKDGAYAAASETSAFPNLGYTTVRDVGPGEIVRLRPDSMEVLQALRDANRSVRSYGSTTDSPQVTTTESTSNTHARTAAGKWERKTPLKPTAYAASPTQA